MNYITHHNPTDTRYGFSSTRVETYGKYFFSPPRFFQITLFAETKVSERFHRFDVFPGLHPWARLQPGSQSSGHDQKNGTQDIRRPDEIGTGY